MNELDQIKKILPITNAEISPTFCLAKWHHTTIYLATGETHSCYHPAPHPIPLEELKDNPSALHNTKEKKEQRNQMLCGEKPGGCNYCWKIEAMGKDFVSDRHIKTASIYTPERVAEIKEKGKDFNVNPEYIEISFSNECNFKCGYCHPKASSRYWKEIEDHGPYSMSSTHRQDIDWFKVYKNEEENPYVKAWWKWWPEVSKTLNILRITGGEPLMHKSLWDLFDKLDKDPKPHIQIEVNSNMGVKTALVHKLTETVKKLKAGNKIRSFKLYTSIDTWGPRAEYIRTGLDLKLWEENLDYYLSNTGWPVTFMITFNIFSVASFNLLLEKILEWRVKYNSTANETQWQRIRFDTPHLKEPSIYDMNILPKKEFMPFMHKHLKFMEKHQKDGDRTKFDKLEVEKFRRVVNYMETTHYEPDKLKQAHKDFYNWFTEFDKRKGTDLVKTFPELEVFYDDCFMATMEGKTLCMLPWVHMYVGADGNVLPCCIGDYKQPLGNTHKNNIKEIWNSQKYKTLRLQMLNNEKPTVCNQCWKHEEAGGESSRYNKNKMFKEDLPLIEKTNSDGSLDEMKLRYMDVRWSNICNFKCRTCSASFSSTWAQEDNENGDKKDIFIFAGGKDNDSLYKQFKPHFKDVKVFYFAGGEPLVTDKHYDILEHLIETNNTDVALHYNSNLSNLFYKKKCITELWNKFTDVKVAASLDSWGDRAEYIREGTEWSVIIDNLNRVKNDSPHVNITFNSVISVFNILTITDFLTYMESNGFKTNHGVLYNLVHPDHYHINVLPSNLKQLAYQKIVAHAQTVHNKGMSMQLQGVLDYINDSKFDEIAQGRFIANTLH